MCKHLVGLGLSAKDITLPQKLIGKKLKMPLKRKPPALAVKALVYQPNYAPPSNNINTDNMDSPQTVASQPSITIPITVASHTESQPLTADLPPNCAAPPIIAAGTSNALQPGSLMLFGSYGKENSLSGQCMTPEYEWAVVPAIFNKKETSKFGRHGSSFTHMGGNRIIISGGIDSLAQKRVSVGTT